MSLLTQPPSASPTLAEITAGTLKSATRQLHQQALRAQEQGIRQIWQNPTGLTPQQACDSLGTNAAKFFQLHGALTDFLLAVASLDGITPAIAVPTNAFTLNPDGTVTVLEQPYSPT